MTKKQELFELAKADKYHIRELHLKFALPYSNGKWAETIIVPPHQIDNKLKYLEEMYNDDLEMKHNAQVKIIGFAVK